jgi:ankyrin repeat protein
MQIAARNGNVSLLKLLLLHGGSLRTRGLRNDTLFHLAGYNGHVETMRWLHRMGAFPEAVDIYGQTVIHVAARRAELSVLKYLHEDLNMDGFEQEDFNGRTPLDCVPRRGPPVVDLCRDYLTDIYNEHSSDDDEGFSLKLLRRLAKKSN